MHDADPELDAIRNRLRAEMMQPAPPAASAAPALDHPFEVTDATFQAEVGKHPLLVLDVWATWCPPCRVLAPTLDALAKELAGKVAFGKLDADENPRVPQAFGVQGLPTLLVFQDGRLADRIVGVLPKPALAARLQALAQRRAGTPGPRRM